MVDQTRNYDVIVVGSGASGGWAAKRLSEAGLKVALVDAGRPQKDSNFTEHEPEFKLKYRNMAPELIRKTRPVQKDCYACMEYNYDCSATISKNLTRLIPTCLSAGKGDCGLPAGAPTCGAARAI